MLLWGDVQRSGIVDAGMRIATAFELRQERIPDTCVQASERVPVLGKMIPVDYAPSCRSSVFRKGVGMWNSPPGIRATLGREEGKTAAVALAVMGNAW